MYALNAKQRLFCQITCISHFHNSYFSDNAASGQLQIQNITAEASSNPIYIN